MIRLAEVDNPRLGQAYIDYMASRDILVEMMPEGEGLFALWLLHDQDAEEAKAEFSAFIRDPGDPKYSEASWKVAESRKRQFRYHSPSVGSMIAAKAGPVTLMGMVVCGVIFFAQIIGFERALLELFHFPASSQQAFEIWRWFTHAILHFSVLHIVFNVLWWWQLGGDIERKLGSGKVIQIFLVSAAVSGLGQFIVAGPNFGGLSGVVYALLGYIWMLSWKAPHLGVTIAKPIVGFMLVWLIFGFAQPFMAIANTAHVMGLVAGCVMGLVDAHTKRVLK
ncbi:rhomboid family intramembrane serine protease GlpG [Vibrio nigripulchritudo]|uniref:rhomboid family intramembrane serine protease GlpG n=1 Tax=Vibrio nigripulchritudo TaxID=28173 RepID=UPI0005F9FC0E|nr:rhomboid family intramembrane serine protease GlpG [Vibrio nigripulchritudo]KJY67290.1 intramembrane serine protease GlpG [Vibrio nigripulchritudo]